MFRMERLQQRGSRQLNPDSVNDHALILLGTKQDRHELTCRALSQHAESETGGTDTASHTYWHEKGYVNTSSASFCWHNKLPKHARLHLNRGGRPHVYNESIVRQVLCESTTPAGLVIPIVKVWQA